MANTSEFIRNMLQMVALRNQQEDAERQAVFQNRTSAAGALSVLQSVLRNTRDPSQQGALVEGFRQQYMPEVSTEAFQNLLTGTVPSAETLRTGEAQQGLVGMAPETLARTRSQAASTATTGMDLSASGLSGFLHQNLSPMLDPQNEGDRAVGRMFGDAQLARAISGQTPEQFSTGQLIRQYLANADEGTRDQIAGINLGLRPDAEATLGANVTMRGQDITRQLGVQGNQLQMLGIQQQGAIAMAQMQLRLQEIQSQMSAGQAPTPAQLIDLQKYQAGLVGMLQQGGLPPYLQQQVVTQLDNANAMLSRYGLQSPDLDPSRVVERGNNWLPGDQIGTFPMYPPQATQQQMQGAQNLMGQPPYFRR